MKDVHIIEFLSGNHYNNVIKKFRSKHKDLLSNYYLMYSEVESRIHDGDLYYQEFDNALIIFQDELDFYSVSIMMDRGTNLPEWHCDKPCIADIGDRGEKLSEYSLEVESMLLGIGFKLFRQHRMYMYDVKNIYENKISKFIPQMNDFLEQEGFSIIPYDERYLEEVHHMWESYHERTYLPKKEWMIGDNILFLMIDTKKNNALVGVRMIRKTFGGWRISHLTIDPDYRNRQLAYYLNMYALEYAYKHKIKRIGDWIASDNLPSLRFHKWMGIEDMKPISYRYQWLPK